MAICDYDCPLLGAADSYPVTARRLLERKLPLSAE